MTSSLLNNSNTTTNIIKPLLLGSSLANQMLAMDLPIVQRDARDDKQRWVSHQLGSKVWQFSQPITFTPYASCQPCSARCLFCSENLRKVADKTAANTLRPNFQYFDGLQKALIALRGLKRSYSLSGLEATDNPDWFLQLLALLNQTAEQPFIGQRVLYSNGSELAENRQQELLLALVKFKLSWLEISRHHYKQDINQRIMRFRADRSIADNEKFSTTIKQFNNYFPVRLVCLLQKTGINSVAEINNYLNWAQQLGVKTVIFREMSRLDNSYRANNTARYIENNRVSLEPIIKACLQDRTLGYLLQPEQLTNGYYFWNLKFHHKSGMKIIFECSDYAVMRQCHAENRVYKLVYFANGQLCADWQPNHHVLMECINH